MNPPIRRTAFVLFGVFLLLLGMLSYVQVVAGPRYRDDPRNARVALSRAGRERGGIVTADGVVVAESVARADDPRVYQRNYPEGARYAYPVGYTSLLFGDAGLERERAGILTSGRNSTISALLEVLGGGDLQAEGLRLTIDDELQETAAAALGGLPGAIVALDPRTGAVLAAVSHPSFDPNLLVGNDAAENGERLENDEGRPLLDRTIRETYPPGSIFKIITTAAALESGSVNTGTTFPDVAVMEFPDGGTLPNFDEELCADGTEVTLATAFERSCNTVFAALGMEIGAEALVGTAEDFGFTAEVPYELDVLRSFIPGTAELDPVAVAQSSIGQRDVRATPLLMALMAAAVANDGVIMEPYLVGETFSADGEIVSRQETAPWRRAVSPATARTLSELMERVVTSGTGTRAAVPGVRVAGKTGTAEVPTGPPHAWFVGFAPVDPDPGQRQIAFAVLVESGGDVGERATGGTVAAPIAAQLIEAWLAAGS